MTILCSTCAVERASAPADGELCPICADERQYVPRAGQAWTTVDELVAAGHRLVLGESEPGLASLHAEPGVGIGQTTQIVVSQRGGLIWDPPGLITDEAVDQVRALGPVAAIAASHPHMFGCQLDWAEALDVPVLVNEDDRDWLQRTGDRIRFWRGSHRVTEEITLHQFGGHFTGASVAHWPGRDGRGVLLAGDTIFVNPNGTRAAFMRSYPNLIPLSAAVVRRIAEAARPLAFDRLYNNFARAIPRDAHRIVQDSAELAAAWASGAHDALT